MELLLRTTENSSIFAKTAVVWHLCWCFEGKLKINMIKKILTYYCKGLTKEASFNLSFEFQL